ncbi:hypothetical protein C8Q74DRAFT_1188479 [Fomes fomentarius]|nr:hypothetical protein C8Q74DRAFT_1188479 [Fomes fomentarius]
MTEPLTSIEKVLAASLHPGSNRDVCLRAYSRKQMGAAGVVTVYRPLPILVVGSVLKETEHFAKLLDSGFSESCDAKTVSPLQQSAGELEYDYDSDSDLDEEEEEGDTDQVHQCEPATSTYREIMIPNLAYRTLCAMVFYLYTGKTYWLPLRSQGMQQRNSEVYKLQGIPACSPKSMYRLADAYGMKVLQERALDAITQRLTADNIVEEVFSSFCYKYEILHRRALVTIGLLYQTPEVQEGLRRIIPRVVGGEFPHSAATLEALLGIQKLDPMKPVPCTGSSASKFAEGDTLFLTREAGNSYRQ